MERESESKRKKRMRERGSCWLLRKIKIVVAHSIAPHCPDSEQKTGKEEVQDLSRVKGMA